MEKVSIKLPICNQKPERAPHIMGHTFILCWRCTGIVLGTLCMLICRKIFHILFATEYFIVAVAIMLPMVCDGIMQYGYSVVSNNSRRFVTGLLFGSGLAYAIGFMIIRLDTLENHSVLVTSSISIIGFIITFLCIKLEMHKTLKENLVEQQRTIYAGCYRKISIIERNPTLIFDKAYYNAFVECSAELSLSASCEVIAAFSSLEKVVIEGYERYRDFIDLNDPHGNNNNYDWVTQSDDEEPIEVYRGTDMDDKIFDTKLNAYVKENSPLQSELKGMLRMILNAMRTDIGNSRLD